MQAQASGIQSPRKWAVYSRGCTPGYFMAPLRGSKFRGRTVRRKIAKHSSINRFSRNYDLISAILLIIPTRCTIYVEGAINWNLAKPNSNLSSVSVRDFIHAAGMYFMHSASCAFIPLRAAVLPVYQKNWNLQTLGDSRPWKHFPKARKYIVRWPLVVPLLMQR